MAKRKTSPEQEEICAYRRWVKARTRMETLLKRRDEAVQRLDRQIAEAEAEEQGAKDALKDVLNEVRYRNHGIVVTTTSTDETSGDDPGAAPTGEEPAE